jgi:hypothetical protein
VQAWDRVDSTTITIRDARREACPRTGDDAALTGHTVLSVGCGAPGRYHCSPAREPDSPPLQIDASWRGYGRLADLADARLTRLRAGETDDVGFVIRLKDTWQPKLEASARGQVTQAFCPGTDLDSLRAADSLRLDDRAITADGRVGGGTNPLPLRRVGVQTPQGDGCFRTNLPPRIGPRQVADRSGVRWEVERRIKLDHSVHRLDQLDAERP